ncbi:Ribosomal RNA small subunit methyltransferase B [Porphyridium purpureum]|uniref:Ribosomal RNA small subunit methyltransferase B n=1 Tax=Porphyridium purpureum TaxID=35688 RepID=A0A5J4Z981_PORPP|nr:Ribosomal RNA small subunit methyltransferase B [Porphyridium purpureum]|eukprot:POR9771..scf295_1
MFVGVVESAALCSSQTAGIPAALRDQRPRQDKTCGLCGRRARCTTPVPVWCMVDSARGDERTRAPNLRRLKRASDFQAKQRIRGVNRTPDLGQKKDQTSASANAGNMTKALSAREAVYFAVQQSLARERFLVDGLDEWQRVAQPDSRDVQFAQLLARTVVQRVRTLDWMLDCAFGLRKGHPPHPAQCIDVSGQRLRPKFRLVLRIALAQKVFMRVPNHAIAQEGIKLAKKFAGGASVTRLATVMLREICSDEHSAEFFTKMLPLSDTVESIGVRFSFPDSFVEQLIHQHSLEHALEVLEIFNSRASVMARERHAGSHEPPRDASSVSVKSFLPEFKGDLPMWELSGIDGVRDSAAFYIQNATPAALLAHALNSFVLPSLESKSFVRIVDMCASPGGKTLLLNDLFDRAASMDFELVSNDVSAEKLNRLRENGDKYGLGARVSFSECDGRLLKLTEPVDLVVADVPCSNSGVLHRRAEARWRLEDNNTSDGLLDMQSALLMNAFRLVGSAGGFCVYATCSILQRENQDVVQSCISRWNEEEHAHRQRVELLADRVLLPNRSGWDGGYMACLRIYADES